MSLLASVAMHIVTLILCLTVVLSLSDSPLGTRLIPEQQHKQYRAWCDGLSGATLYDRQKRPVNCNVPAGAK